VLVVPSSGGGIDGPLIAAYDGSNPARAAVRMAGRLLGARNAIVVHVAGSPMHAGEAARERAAIAPHADRARARTVDGTNGAADAVLAAAGAADASVVVPGSRARGKVGSMLLGSVSMRLVHDASLPVLIVTGRRHARGKDWPPRRRRSSSARRGLLVLATIAMLGVRRKDPRWVRISGRACPRSP
jgi:nucleotide-binding universal stress UspA family protein